MRLLSIAIMVFAIALECGMAAGEGLTNSQLFQHCCQENHGILLHGSRCLVGLYPGSINIQGLNLFLEHIHNILINVSCPNAGLINIQRIGCTDIDKDVVNVFKEKVEALNVDQVGLVELHVLSNVNTSMTSRICQRVP